TYDARPTTASLNFPESRLQSPALPYATATVTHSSRSTARQTQRLCHETESSDGFLAAGTLQYRASERRGSSLCPALSSMLPWRRNARHSVLLDSLLYRGTGFRLRCI